MRRALLLAIALAAPGAAASETPSVTATPSKGEVCVGEVFRVEVKATGPPGAVWTFPAEAGDDAVELRTPPPEAKDGQAGAAPDTHHYAAAVFSLGEVGLPAIRVEYRLADGTAGAVSTAPVTLRVVSTLPKDPARQQLVDIREPQPLAVGAIFWTACAVAAVLVAAAATWLWRRRRPAPVLADAVAERPADTEAREALDRLAASGLLARGEYRAYYIALAEIAKRYLERRLEAPVLEMTSTEAVGFLRDHPHGHGLVAPLREIAGAADQVKFARGQAQREEAERHLAAAREVVGLLESRLLPAAPAGAGERVA